MRVSDSDLCTRIACDDKKAFELLYEQYWEDVFTYAARIVGTDEEALDVVQEVYVGLWEQRKRAKEIQAVKGYLLQMAKYKAIDVLRRKLKQTDFYQTCIELRESQQVDTPYDIKIAKDLAIFIEGCLDQMPPKTKEVFQLSRFAQLSHKAIAAQLHISEGTVKKQIFYALRICRYRLNRSRFWNGMLSFFLFLICR